MKNILRVRALYMRVRMVHIRVMDGIAVWIFSLLYVVVLPLFVVFRNKSIMKPGWHQWTHQDDLLSDVRKQY